MTNDIIKKKRLNIIVGHYGSGKTNAALNIAALLRKDYEKVTVGDLDIVNPYFRTKDSADELKKLGIGLIVSKYAGGNLDIPALPSDLYSITEDQSTRFVLDIGGDDRGAYVLGRLAPFILEENSYNCFLVINMYRPLTRTPEEVKEVMDEINAAGGIACTGIINNSNLGRMTTAKTVTDSVDYAKKVEEITGIKVQYTTVARDLYEELKDRIENVIPLDLQRTPADL